MAPWLIAVIIIVVLVPVGIIGYCLSGKHEDPKVTWENAMRAAGAVF